jgi:hypothetical protein
MGDLTGNEHFGRVPVYITVGTIIDRAQRTYKTKKEENFRLGKLSDIPIFYFEQ